MKLLFDENLANRLVIALAALYPDSQHVRDVGMASAEDDVIWKYARDNGMTIVSKDFDFYHRSMVLGHPPKVVWLRLGNCTTNQILEILRAHQADLLAFDQDVSASFLVLP